MRKSVGDRIQPAARTPPRSIEAASSLLPPTVLRYYHWNKLTCTIPIPALIIASVAGQTIMSLLKATLTQLEAHLQSMIEGSAARLFPSGDTQKDLVQRLIASMKAGIKTDRDGRLIAPNLFTLVVHPELVGVLRDHEALLDELAQTLQDAVTGAGLCFLSSPTIRIAEDANFTSQQVQVVAQISSENLSQTTELGVDTVTESAMVPKNAYLIVNGTQVYSLSQSVTNIGRSPDNQLVIDDQRISRTHAQLRLVKGRFVIFDLDSTSGTFVNGQKIHQCILLPGDLISLAGVPLVFNQETPGQGETQKIES